MIEADLRFQAENIILNDTFLFAFPLQLEVLDSIIVVLDRTDGAFFHLFDTAGRYLNRFGNIGKGPGELINAETFSVSADKKKIITYDLMGRKILTYDIPALLNDKLVYRETALNYDLLPETNTPSLILDAIRFTDDSTFLVVGNHDQLRFGVYRQENLFPVYNDYPDCMDTPNREEIWSVFNHSACWRFSPDRSRFITATYIGGIMELFQVNPPFDLIPSKQLYIYYPDYSIAQGAVPTCVAYHDRTQIGFQDISVSNQHIYTLLHAPGEADYPYSVHIFDWEGNSISVYETDRRLGLISIDEKSGRIYTMTENEEVGYGLGYFCTES